MSVIFYSCGTTNMASWEEHLKYSPVKLLISSNNKAIVISQNETFLMKTHTRWIYRVSRRQGKYSRNKEIMVHGNQRETSDTQKTIKSWSRLLGTLEYWSNVMN
jgi:hypothetical protein